jgi:hypothetical protein
MAKNMARVVLLSVCMCAYTTVALTGFFSRQDALRKSYAAALAAGDTQKNEKFTSKNWTTLFQLAASIELKKTAPRKQQRQKDDEEEEQEEVVVDATAADDEDAIPDAGVEVVGDDGEVGSMHVLGASVAEARGGAEEPSISLLLDSGAGVAVVVEMRSASLREAVGLLQTIMCENLLGVQRDQLPATAAGHLYAFAVALTVEWTAIETTPDGKSTKAMVKVSTLLFATTQLLLAVCSCVKSIDGVVALPDNIRCLLKDATTTYHAVLAQLLVDGGVSAAATSLPAAVPASPQSSNDTDDAIVLDALQLLHQRSDMMSPNYVAQLLTLLSTLPCSSAPIVTDAILAKQQEKEETERKQGKQEEDEEEREMVVEKEEKEKEEEKKEKGKGKEKVKMDEEKKEEKQDKKGKRKGNDLSAAPTQRSTALEAAAAGLNCFFWNVKIDKILLEVKQQLSVR